MTISLTKTAATIWRDYNTDGVPASGKYNPDKADIRTFGAEVVAYLNTIGDFKYTATQIAGDWNSAVTAGTYYGNAGVTNAPGGLACRVLVVQQTTNEIGQFAVTSDGRFYSRSRVAGTWGSWIHAANQADITTLNARNINTSTGLTGGGNLSADRTLSLTGQALALHNLGTNGIVARTGAGTVAARTLTAGSGISISNGDGVSGNPTISVSGLALTNFGAGVVVDSTATIAANLADTKVATTQAIVNEVARRLSQIVVVQEQYTAGTNGATPVSGSWQKRALNTSVYNNISGVALSSNEITGLPAGTYEAHAVQLAEEVDRLHCRLYDVTGAAALLYGTSQLMSSAADNYVEATLIGVFTISVTSTVRLEYRLSDAVSGRLGTAANFSVNEVYATLFLRKLT